MSYRPHHLLPVLLCLSLFLLSCGCTGTAGIQDQPVPTGTATPAATTGENTATGSALLTVLSDPPYAAILLDGTYTGTTTPGSIRIPAGSHTVRVEASNGRSAEQQINIREDTTLSFDIPAAAGKFGTPLTEQELSKTGWAVVKAADPYVYISVNANRIVRDVVQTPYVIPALKEGLVGIKIEDITSSGREFGFSEGTFPVISGLYSPVTFTGGTETLDMFSITSSAYAGYPYSVSGAVSPGRIPESREWPSDYRFISLKTPDGYVSYPRAAAGTSSVVIEPRDVTWYPLTVTSSPSGADILIDGIPTGKTTPWTIQNVSDGFHTVLVSHPGYLPQEKDLLLAGDAEAREVSFPDMEPYTNGYLVVESDEPGAFIMMYGRDTGDRTPTVYPAFPIGTAEITVITSTGKSLTKTVTVLPDTVTTVHADFSV